MIDDVVCSLWNQYISPVTTIMELETRRVFIFISSLIILTETETNGANAFLLWLWVPSCLYFKVFLFIFSLPVENDNVETGSTRIRSGVKESAQVTFVLSLKHKILWLYLNWLPGLVGAYLCECMESKDFENHTNHDFLNINSENHRY